MRERGKKGKGKRGAGRTLLMLLAAIVIFAAPVRSARACPGPGCETCGGLILDDLITRIDELFEELIETITEQMKHYQDWFMSAGEYQTSATGFFYEYVQVALEMMTEQLTYTGMYQVYIAGSMLDAKQQLETQRLIHRKTAEAHRDYQSSAHFCTLGTAAIGMAAASRLGTVNAVILEQRSQDRQLGNVNVAAAEGPDIDMRTRVTQFIARYCDEGDNNDGMGKMCGPNTPARRQTINRDIDYVGTMWNRMSLDLNLTDGVQSRDDQDVLALAANLFGHQVGRRKDTSVVSNEANVEDYMDLRAVAAKRSVAENSFYALIGLKSAGSPASQNEGPYVAAALHQLGADQASALEWMGQRPSQYGMMEVMAQRVYQDPEFFSSLYDTPANVMRKDAAMRAINLMVGRDMFRSELRYEAMLDVLLEIEIDRYQRNIQDRLDWMDEEGRKND